MSLLCFLSATRSFHHPDSVFRPALSFVRQHTPASTPIPPASRPQPTLTFYHYAFHAHVSSLLALTSTFFHACNFSQSTHDSRIPIQILLTTEISLPLPTCYRQSTIAIPIALLCLCFPDHHNHNHHYKNSAFDSSSPLLFANSYTECDCGNC
ncbi:hypothetical protein BDZ94DRAFT_1260549 [Collybia nuda]|uniref:Uncharacterized protein n=1 Tax=Collybia nuda TaxID=64659 RepID=A0A9P6CHV9_9AGAR|nr:hypothetical protein BDZ94DRAFT_1260549 [Collybia nuda]